MRRRAVTQKLSKSKNIVHKKMVNFKMRKELHLGKGATFHFGIREMEELNPGIVFLGDWSYFDSQEKKLGWLRFLGRVGLFRKAQWKVHYRLTGAVT